MDKIGYMGPKGTFSEQAALYYGAEAMLISYPTITDVLLAVEEGEVQKGVVPIENSIEGAVNTTLDMLMFDVNLSIQTEIVIPIEHHLLVNPGIKIEDITQVLSHIQALGQCRKFIHGSCPNATLVSTSSTAEGAKIVAEKKNFWAAVGTKLSADTYGLTILRSNIQDQHQNETRFVVVGKEDVPYQEGCKTSLAFSTDNTNRPGELYKVLDIFALWDLNMTKIVSRPAKNGLGEYVFFVDLEGHREQEDLKDALRMVQRKTSFFKIMGSYQIFT
jgi:prephenate dehydratase